MRIERATTVVPLTIANGAALSAAVDMSLYSGGYVELSASWSAAALGFCVSATNETFLPLLDEDGLSAIQIAAPAATAAACVLPADVFGAKWLKLWSKHLTAGTLSDVNQSGDASLVLVLKS